jgi:hypothetical protein
MVNFPCSFHSVASTVSEGELFSTVPAIAVVLVIDRAEFFIGIAQAVTSQKALGPMLLLSFQDPGQGKRLSFNNLSRDLF